MPISWLIVIVFLAVLFLYDRMNDKLDKMKEQLEQIESSVDEIRDHFSDVEVDDG
jgi:uncharacterized membrane protein